MKNKRLKALLLSAFLLAGCNAETYKPPPTTATPPPEVPAQTEEITTPPEPIETPAPVIRTAGEATYYEQTPYEAVGTGMKRPIDFMEKCRTAYNCYLNYGYLDNKPDFSSIKDEAVRSAVQSWMAVAEAEISAEIPAFEAFCEARGYAYYKAPNWTEKFTTPPNCSAFAKNGYLSVRVYLPYYDKKQMEYGFYDCRSAIFDLYTGEKLELSDLFFSGEEFVDDLNAEISRKFTAPMFNSEYYMDGPATKNYPVKRTFAGLTKESLNFSDSIYFPHKNPFIDASAEVPLSRLYSCVLNYPRDMAGIFDDTVEVYEYAENHTTFLPGYPTDSVLVRELIRDCFFLSPEQIEKVNSTALSMLSDKEVIALAKDRFGWDIAGKGSDDYYERCGLEIEVLADRNLICISIAPTSQGFFAGAINKYLDLETLRVLTPEELVARIYGEDWEENYLLDKERYTFPEAPDISEFGKYDFVAFFYGGDPEIAFYPPVGAEIEELDKTSGFAWRVMKKYKPNN